MSEDQVRAGSPNGGIRFDTRRFDTDFLKRNWIKVLIQEVPGGQYWQCTGLWTSEFQEATSFATCTAAMAQATHLNLASAQLVLTRESKAYGVIPLKGNEANCLPENG